MRYLDAVAKCRELGTKSQEHADTAERASQTYSAVMTLYNVAASAGDEHAMQQHRDVLHATVDTILDSGAMISKLKTEMERIARSVTDYPQQF